MPIQTSAGSVCMRMKAASKPLKDQSLSVRLQRQDSELLRAFARQRQTPPRTLGSRYIVEGLRRDRFSGIDFRDTALGRTAFLAGSRLPVWMVVEVIQEYGGSVPKTARHFDRPVRQIQAAIEYAQAFPEELESALAARNAVSPADLRRLLPGLTGGDD